MINGRELKAGRLLHLFVLDTTASWGFGSLFTWGYVVWFFLRSRRVLTRRVETLFAIWNREHFTARDVCVVDFVPRPGPSSNFFHPYTWYDLLLQSRSFLVHVNRECLFVSIFSELTPELPPRHLPCDKSRTRSVPMMVVVYCFRRMLAFANLLFFSEPYHERVDWGRSEKDLILVPIDKAFHSLHLLLSWKLWHSSLVPIYYTYCKTCSFECE